MSADMIHLRLIFTTLGGMQPSGKGRFRSGKNLLAKLFGSNKENARGPPFPENVWGGPPGVLFIWTISPQLHRLSNFCSDIEDELEVDVAIAEESTPETSVEASTSLPPIEQASPKVDTIADAPPLEQATETNARIEVT